MLKKLALLFALISFINADEILIFAAASLKFALQDIKIEFLKNRPNDKININFLSSGKAYAQILNHAPAHIFIAADEDYPKKLYEKSSKKHSPKPYAQGSLVLFSTNKNLVLNSLEILKDKNIKHIAMPNPKLAPYGFAAQTALENSNLYEIIKPKIALGESISAATQFVHSGACEIGFSALSMVINDKNANYFIIDSSLHAPINQSLIITDFGADSKLAKKFSEFLLHSANVKEILKKYGYKNPQ